MAHEVLKKFIDLGYGADAPTSRSARLPMGRRVYVDMNKPLDPNAVVKYEELLQGEQASVNEQWSFLRFALTYLADPELEKSASEIKDLCKGGLLQMWFERTGSLSVMKGLTVENHIRDYKATPRGLVFNQDYLESVVEAQLLECLVEGDQQALDRIVADFKEEGLKKNSKVHRAIYHVLATNLQMLVVEGRNNEGLGGTDRWTPFDKETGTTQGRMLRALENRKEVTAAEVAKLLLDRDPFLPMNAVFDLEDIRDEETGEQETADVA
ncbi:hypothetical protein P152DRAFT_475119 [Eremomyces bilateralis CBS 781.70]|uniref:Uncharacterized protein n=1 Tax=Eremomyces bilateralis CBS 781.70 TaxID=1392243 RepID=A0A6G1FZF7_9PEZI|nr:uncharacterized protein P152DRAFT_475119 [Eremomyces bilateralis CBS 781.70]KAF1811071.1 hypothetical protein P152DRAFT_475119 [Eremomyces bilateralis CBS 781.70]